MCFVVMRKNTRFGSREPDVLCGDEKEYETGWPENRMCFVVMRKNTRFGSREPDVICVDEK
jgi:hypothetical protein